MIFTFVPKSDKCYFSPRSFWENWRQFSFYVILPLLVERVPVALLICRLHSLKVMSPKRKEIYCKEICKTFIYLQDIANVGMLSLTNAPKVHTVVLVP